VADQVKREKLVTGTEVGVVPAADHVLDAASVRRLVAAEPWAAVHMTDVLAVEDEHGREDREVAEHPGPPQVPAAATVRGAEEREEVVDHSAHKGTVVAIGPVTAATQRTARKDRTVPMVTVRQPAS